MMEATSEILPLDSLAPGEAGFIRRLGGGRGFVSRLATLGFTVGAEVQMVQNYRHGPLIVMVHNCRVALGRGEAAKVLVSRQQASDNRQQARA